MAAKKASPAPPPRPPPPPRPKVVAWLEELSRAGMDMGKAKALLNRVQMDVNATRTDKEHFYRTLAQQSLIWYMGALRGSPLTGDEIKQAAKEAMAKAKKKAKK